MPEIVLQIQWFNEEKKIKEQEALSVFSNEEFGQRIDCGSNTNISLPQPNSCPKPSPWVMF